MLANRLRSSNAAAAARALGCAAVVILIAACDGPGGSTPTTAPAAQGVPIPKAVTPRLVSTLANLAAADDEEPPVDEQVMFDQGPAAGTPASCYTNRLDGHSYADRFVVPEGATITAVQVFACLPEVGDSGRVVRLKLLAGADKFPGERLYEIDATPSVAFSGSNTSPYMVTVRLPQPFVAEPGVTYWVGVTGKGFEMTQTAILGPGDGMMALFERDTLRGLTAAGDMTFRLLGTPRQSNSAPTAKLVTATPQVAEGSPVQFTLTASDPDGDSLYYSVNFGDGGTSGVVTSSPMTISYVYADNSRPDTAYTATIMVHDARGHYAFDSVAVTVTNVAPSIAPIPDGDATAGGSYNLRVTYTDPGIFDAPFSYTIAWGDGTSTVGATGSSNVVFASHKYAARGEYTVDVEVTDKDGGSDRATAKVRVGNQAPTVSLAGPPTADEGTPVSFVATATDPDGDSLTYAWDYDGDRVIDTTTTAGSASHRYADNGTYFATVIADDRHGGVDTATYRIVVANVAPAGVLSAPGSVNEGEVISLTVSNLADPSSADVGAGLLTAFSCDGLSYGPFGTSRTESCVALDDGARAVGAKLRDKDEGTSTYTRTVLVTNVAPSVDAGTDQVVVSGETISLPGRFSDPGAADGPWSWSWSSGQSGSATMPSESLIGSYRACSAATLSLTVQDKDNGVGSDAMVVAVTPREVAVDVKADALSLKEAGGFVVVHVFSAAGFDATSLDPATIRLTNGSGTGTPLERFVADRDLNGDGRVDANVRFVRADLIHNGDLTPTTTRLTLTGVAGGCTQVSGSDAVTVR